MAMEELLGRLLLMPQEHKMTDYRITALKEIDRRLSEYENLRKWAENLAKRAESVITTDAAGNRFRHVFADDLDHLNEALYGAKP